MQKLLLEESQQNELYTKKKFKKIDYQIKKIIDEFDENSTSNKNNFIKYDDVLKKVETAVSSHNKFLNRIDSRLVDYLLKNSFYH